MIGLTRAVRVFAYTAPTDMRRSYNGLESLVRRELGHDIMDGDLFLFINRRRNQTT
jgi:transposase